MHELRLRFAIKKAAPCGVKSHSISLNHLQLCAAEHFAQIAYVPKTADEARLLIKRTNYLSENTKGWSQYQKAVVVQREECMNRSRRCDT